MRYTYDVREKAGVGSSGHTSLRIAGLHGKVHSSVLKISAYPLPQVRVLIIDTRWHQVLEDLMCNFPTFINKLLWTLRGLESIASASCHRALGKKPHHFPFLHTGSSAPAVMIIAEVLLLFAVGGRKPSKGPKEFQ